MGDVTSTSKGIKPLPELSLPPLPFFGILPRQSLCLILQHQARASSDPHREQTRRADDLHDVSPDMALLDAFGNTIFHTSVVGSIIILKALSLSLMLRCW